MKMILLVGTIIFLNSCKLLDVDGGALNSFDDPFFLRINDIQVSCEGNSITNRSDWLDQYEYLLDRYRVSSHKINFNELKNSSSKELCSAVNYLKSISIEDTTNADLFNIYNLLVIHLIVEGYDQTLKLGEQDLPQNYSVLNILDKGVKIFDEVKWNISGKLMNLNDIEYLVKQRMGDSAQLLLFRGAIGFGGLPTSPYQLSSIQNKVNENLYDVVNNKTFYDDFTSPKSFIVPGEINHLVTDSIEKLRISVDTLRFAIFNNNIDLAVWGSVVKENELVKVEDEEYVWKLELDFSNWQLAQ